MKFQLQFTKVFSEAREKRGITMREVYEAAGINEATLYRALSNNGETLAMPTFVAICAALGLDPRKCWVRL